MTSKNQTIALSLFALALLLYVPFLAAVHLFDWDEINFAEAAREMLETGNYALVQIDYTPFWEKPPFFFWLQAVCMHIFGVGEFAARLPNAICGAFTLLVLFRIGTQLKDRAFGLFWAILYMASILPFFYFKSGIIDPWFNLFIFFSIVYLFKYFQYTEKAFYNAGLGGLFLGLATLTKGPVAILIVAITVGCFAFLKRRNIRFRFIHVGCFFLITFCIGSIWFIALLLYGNAEIIHDFIAYQVRLFQTRDAGHGGPFFYHFLVLLLGCFPASFLALPVLVKKPNWNEENASFSLWMLLLFWIVLLLFSIVKTKIIHYSSLCYFPLTFFAATYMYKLFRESKAIPGLLSAFIFVYAVLLAVLVLCIPFINHFREQLLAHNIPADAFGKAALMADVSWSGWEGIGGVALLIGAACFIYYRKKDSMRSFSFFSVGMLLFLLISMLYITPSIEKYSQGAAIEFYKERSREKCYIYTLGFKSYAHLFYAKKPEGLNPEEYTIEWLLRGSTDYPVYFVAKIHNAHEYEESYPQLKRLYEKNGFVFFVRVN